jgi:hypothetical protein
MVMYRHQNARENNGLLTANKSFNTGSVMTVTQQNCMHEELRADEIPGMFAASPECFVFPSPL